jgi:hypothetical protein
MARRRRKLKCASADEACFVVRDNGEQALAYVFEEEPSRSLFVLI